MRIGIVLSAWLVAAVCAVPAFGQQPGKEAVEGGGKKPAEAEKAAPKPAPEPEKEAAKDALDLPQAKSSRVEVVRNAKEPPVLVVHYPWTAHNGASVEVRMLAKGETSGPTVHPVKFVELFLKGKVTEAVTAARVRAWDEPSTEKMTERGRNLQILGQRNRMGKTCAMVVFPGLDSPNDKRPQEEMVPRAVFCLLESWSFDSRTLRLELPSLYFKKPCLLRVWFLREGNVLWEETVRWPGLK